MEKIKEEELLKKIAQLAGVINKNKTVGPIRNNNTYSHPPKYNPYSHPPPHHRTYQSTIPPRFKNRQLIVNNTTTKTLEKPIPKPVSSSVHRSTPNYHPPPPYKYSQTRYNSFFPTSYSWSLNKTKPSPSKQSPSKQFVRTGKYKLIRVAVQSSKPKIFKTSKPRYQSFSGFKKSFFPPLVSKPTKITISHQQKLHSDRCCEVCDKNQSKLNNFSQKLQQSKRTLQKAKEKKKQYCLFFNKFGSCNLKEKCRYIHDPTKISICRKFLTKGNCSDQNCHLSHTLQKDQMPTCLFFLRGKCNNEDCKFAHVRVNPNAPMCENFLKGYCPDGLNCKRKHTLLCKSFLKTGECTVGSKCKWEHKTKEEIEMEKTKKLS